MCKGQDEHEDYNPSDILIGYRCRKCGKLLCKGRIEGILEVRCTKCSTDTVFLEK